MSYKNHAVELELDKATRNNKNLTTENSSLKDNVAARDRVIHHLETELLQSTTELDELRSAFKDTKARLKTTQDRLKTVEANYKDTSEMLRTLKNSLIKSTMHADTQTTKKPASDPSPDSDPDPEPDHGDLDLDLDLHPDLDECRVIIARPRTISDPVDPAEENEVEDDNQSRVLLSPQFTPPKLRHTSNAPPQLPSCGLRLPWFRLNVSRFVCWLMCM